MRVSLTDAASADLDDIFLYIALDDPAAAARTVDHLTETSSDLSEFPNRGRLGAEPATRDLLTVAPYVTGMPSPPTSSKASASATPPRIADAHPEPHALPHP